VTTPQEKQKQDKIIKHILQTNKHNTLSKIKQKKQKIQEDTHNNTTTKMGKIYIYWQRNPHHHQTLQTHQPTDRLQDQ
jgi:hypothetical protein